MQNDNDNEVTVSDTQPEAADLSTLVDEAFGAAEGHFKTHNFSLAITRQVDPITTAQYQFTPVPPLASTGAKPLAAFPKPKLIKDTTAPATEKQAKMAWSKAKNEFGLTDEQIDALCQKLGSQNGTFGLTQETLQQFLAYLPEIK